MEYAIVKNVAIRRQTKQRNAILNSMLSARGPLSVAEIHEKAGREIPRLGIATVYRAIKALSDAGKIKAAQLPGEEPRYEPASRGHHHHFRCLSCKQIFDLEICPVGLPPGTRLPGGYTVEEHHLTLYGRCSECLSY